MAGETKIIIVDYDHNPRTGHISVRVKSRTIEENASWDGPEMVYGVDALAFRHRFNGDIEQFEAWVVAEHRHNMGANVKLTAALLARKGRVIG
jgi:hypothetical protein